MKYVINLETLRGDFEGVVSCNIFHHKYFHQFVVVLSGLVSRRTAVAIKGKGGKLVLQRIASWLSDYDKLNKQ